MLRSPGPAPKDLIQEIATVILVEAQSAIQRPSGEVCGDTCNGAPALLLLSLLLLWWRRS